ncbi:MAG: magnesium transporter [Methanobacterium sp.]|uniref:magnesium transporter n=1 Tax=Methanobacterium sp. TaxID=2164 RepID=UPI00258A167A|nr:magnesium transporter [Methanobacterium sp.]MCC7560873.1 magnesium transporter [Methanobacterium sp.]
MKWTEKLVKKIGDIIHIVLNWMARLSVLVSKRSLNTLQIPFIISGKITNFFRDFSRVLGETFTALFICAIGDLIAGILLSGMTNTLEMLPGLLVLIPGAIGMRGNIFGALGSRLGSNLHIGTLTPELKKSPVLNQNIISAMILTVIMSIFLAFAAKGFCILLGFESISIVDFTLISVLGGIFSGALLLPATILISIKSYENGWDPDNVTTPLIAASGDLFTIPSILLAVQILLWIRNGYVDTVLFAIFIIIGIVGFIYGIKSGNHLKKIIVHSTPTLFLSSLFGTTAGTILNGSFSTILSNPSILALVPLFSGESGDLVSILGARLSSGLHIGSIESSLKPTEGALRNFAIIIILAIIIYPLIGVLAYFGLLVTGVESVGLAKMVFISTSAGLMLTPLMLLIAFYLNTISYRKGLDPDNIVIPLSTSITDPVANTFLVMMVMFTLGLSF